MSRQLSILVLSILFLCSCIKEDFNSNTEIALDLTESLERYSVSIYRPNIDFQVLKNDYLNSVINTTDKSILYEETKSFLLSFKDPHIWLIGANKNMYSIENLDYTKNINYSIIESNYLSEVVQHKENIVSATLNDTIGYLYIKDFKGDNSETASIYNSIINNFSNKKGLIIDLRDNDGGSAYNAQSLLEKLIAHKTHWLSTQNRTKRGFDDKYDWYLNPKGSFQYTRKTMVLVGKYTISAGERFAIAAKTLPHMTIIGDTTSNTQGSIMGREMLNGWKYTFTFEKCLSPDGTNYEGVGIDPDIYYNSSSLDLSQNDVILERAILELE